MKKRSLLFIRCSMLVLIMFTWKAGEVLAQHTTSRVIMGTVVSADDQLPLPGVNIVLAGTGIGKITDLDGKYTIEIPNDGAVLEFSFIGFLKQEVVVGNRTVIDIELGLDVKKLEEVVVVGYGTQRRENVSGSVEKLDLEEAVTRPVSNVKNLLIGQIPGLLTNQNPGLPGSDNVDLSIRGFGNPLIIVDGVESFFDRIDPNDIESITVLKDASSAIYGARAGNGVILVTTKRGKAGKTQISYHGWLGRQKEISFPELANAIDYINLGRSAILNDQFNPDDPTAEIVYPADFSLERLEEYTSGRAQSYDWPGGTLKNAGSMIMNHNLSVSGGSEKVRFYTSLGTMSQDGIFDGDYYYDKISITNNLDAQLDDNLVLKFNSSYINEDRDYAASALSDIWTDLITAQPFFPSELPDPERAPFSGFSHRSPVARITQSIRGYNRTNTETLAAALELEYAAPFLKGLSLGARVNTRFRNDHREILSRPYSVYTYEPDSPLADSEGYILQATNSTQSFYQQAYFTGAGAPRRRILSRLFSRYEKSLGDHSFNVLLLGEQENNTFNNLYVSRRELLSYDVPQTSASDELTTIESASTGRQQRYTRVSFAGRFNYSYQNKYLIEGTLRADGSSYFDPDVRWGYFPSISLGWNVHKESFFNNSGLLTNLKLRLSYSETGIDANVGRTTFDYLTGYAEATGQVYFLDGKGVPIIVNQGLANPLITWEETTLYNAGVDFALLDGKIFGTVDVFYRKRDGLLARPIESFPSTFGADLPLTNLNSLSNRGFDMSLGYIGRFNDFKFTLTGNVGLSREKYERWEEDINEEDPFDVKFRKREGKFVSETVFGYVSDGLFQTYDEVEAYLEQYTIEDINGIPTIGDIRYKDLNGDGILNLEDRAQLGYGNFPEMTFGLNMDLEYKNFRLNMLWQGATRFNITIASTPRNPFDNEHVPLQIHADYSFFQDSSNPGVNANPNAELPAFGRNGAHAWNLEFSDYWYKDATYLRLKNATLSYSLPNIWMNSINLQQAEIYLSSDNLLMFNKLGVFSNIIDPEEASFASGFTLPTLRTITFGLRLGL